MRLETIVYSVSRPCPTIPFQRRAAHIILLDECIVQPQPVHVLEDSTMTKVRLYNANLTFYLGRGILALRHAGVEEAYVIVADAWGSAEVGLVSHVLPTVRVSVS